MQGFSCHYNTRRDAPLPYMYVTAADFDGGVPAFKFPIPLRLLRLARVSIYCRQMGSDDPVYFIGDK